MLTCSHGWDSQSQMLIYEISRTKSKNSLAGHHRACFAFLRRILAELKHVIFWRLDHPQLKNSENVRSLAWQSTKSFILTMCNAKYILMCFFLNITAVLLETLSQSWSMTKCRSFQSLTISSTSLARYCTHFCDDNCRQSCVVFCHTTGTYFLDPKPNAKRTFSTKQKIEECI